MALTVAPPLYRSISLDDLELLPDPVWLVDHWCMRQSITLLTGLSESFKTFLAMDLAVKTADASFDRFGPHRIDRSTVHYDGLRVLYVIGESMGAAKFRFKAIKQYHSLPVYPELLRVRPNRVDIYREPDAVIEMVEHDDPDIVIFDTWSRNTYGMDENNKADVDKALKVAHELKMGGSRGGRSVIFIHHPPKSGGQDYRGHTSLLNDTDILIVADRFDPEKNNPVAPFFTKVISRRQKETDDFIPYWAKLVTQPINDAFGHPILKLSGEQLNSLVIESVTEEPTATTPGADTHAEFETYVKAHPAAMPKEIQLSVWGKEGRNVYDVAKSLIKQGKITGDTKIGYTVSEKRDIIPLEDL